MHRHGIGEPQNPDDISEYKSNGFKILAQRNNCPNFYSSKMPVIWPSVRAEHIMRYLSNKDFVKLSRVSKSHHEQVFVKITVRREKYDQEIYDNLVSIFITQEYTEKYLSGRELISLSQVNRNMNDLSLKFRNFLKTEALLLLIKEN